MSAFARSVSLTDLNLARRGLSDRLCLARGMFFCQRLRSCPGTGTRQRACFGGMLAEKQPDYEDAAVRDRLVGKDNGLIPLLTGASSGGVRAEVAVHDDLWSDRSDRRLAAFRSSLAIGRRETSSSRRGQVHEHS